MQNTPGLLDRVWQNLVCAMIGEQLDDGDDVCGAVISIRPKVQRIQIWLRKKNDFDTVERIGHRMLRILEIAEPNVVSALDFAVGRYIALLPIRDNADVGDESGKRWSHSGRPPSSTDR